MNGTCRSRGRPPIGYTMLIMPVAPMMSGMRAPPRVTERDARIALVGGVRHRVVVLLHADPPAGAREHGDVRPPTRTPCGRRWCRSRTPFRPRVSSRARPASRCARRAPPLERSPRPRARRSARAPSASGGVKLLHLRHAAIDNAFSRRLLELEQLMRVRCVRRGFRHGDAGRSASPRARGSPEATPGGRGGVLRLAPRPSACSMCGRSRRRAAGRASPGAASTHSVPALPSCEGRTPKLKSDREEPRSLGVRRADGFVDGRLQRLVG